MLPHTSHLLPLHLHNWSASYTPHTCHTFLLPIPIPLPPPHTHTWLDILKTHNTQHTPPLSSLNRSDWLSNILHTIREFTFPYTPMSPSSPVYWIATTESDACYPHTHKTRSKLLMPIRSDWLSIHTARLPIYQFFPYTHPSTPSPLVFLIATTQSDACLYPCLLTHLAIPSIHKWLPSR